MEILKCVYRSGSSIVAILNLLSKEPCYFPKTVLYNFTFDLYNAAYAKNCVQERLVHVKVINVSLRLHMYDQLHAPVQCFLNIVVS